MANTLGASHSRSTPSLKGDAADQPSAARPGPRGERVHAIVDAISRRAAGERGPWGVAELGAVATAVLERLGRADLAPLVRSPQSGDDGARGSACALAQEVASGRWATDPRLAPQVVGHLLERMVNQRETGAFYTPVDVTRTLCEQTIVPLVCRRAGLADPGSGDRIGAAMRGMFLREPARYLRPDTASRQPGEQADAHAQRGAAGERLRQRMAAGAATLGDLLTAHADLRLLVIDTLGAGDAPHAAERAVAVIRSVRVLDPTCGSGAFLAAAADVLAELLHAAEICLRPAVDPQRMGALWAQVAATALNGVDVEAEALVACRARFVVEAAVRGVALEDVECVDEALRRRLVHGDLLELEDAAALCAGAIDVIVGNPPFVERRPSDGAAALATRSCGNLAAWCAERALAMAAPDASFAFVLPVSVVATDRFAALRAMVEERAAELWVSSFDAVPSTLFPGTVQRVALVVGRCGDGAACRVRTSGYRRWPAEARPALLATTSYIEMPDPVRRRIAPQGARAVWPRIGNEHVRDAFEQVCGHEPFARFVTTKADGDHPNSIWYKRRWSYFLFFADFVPQIERIDLPERGAHPSELKRMDLVDGMPAHAAVAVLSSSLFYAYFTAVSDSRNLNRRDILSFPIGDPAPGELAELADLGRELMQVMRQHSEVRECTYRSIGRVRNRYFFQKPTKPVIDKVDATLADHFALSGPQLRAIQRFDAPFR